MNEEVMRTLSEIIIKNRGSIDISERQKEILKDYLEIDDSDTDFEENYILLDLKIEIRSEINFSKYMSTFYEKSELEERIKNILGINTIKSFLFRKEHEHKDGTFLPYCFIIKLEVYISDESNDYRIKEEIIKEILKKPKETNHISMENILISINKELFTDY